LKKKEIPRRGGGRKSTQGVLMKFKISSIFHDREKKGKDEEKADVGEAGERGNDLGKFLGGTKRGRRKYGNSKTWT